MPWTHFRPSQEQIEESCRLIRQAWDEETHRRRWVQPIKQFWTPPPVRIGLKLEEESERELLVTSI